MAIDQAHEQNNAAIKGDVDAIGLIEDPAALRRCMVAGQEVCRLLAAYEAMTGTIDTRIDSRHHEATVGAQTAFFENVKAMKLVLQDKDNPFQDESSDLGVVGHEEYRRPQSCPVSLYPPSERIAAARRVPRWSSQ